MARTLLNEMLEVAKKRKLQAYVRAENRRMLRVFDRHQFVRQPGESLREVFLELDVASASPG